MGILKNLVWVSVPIVLIAVVMYVRSGNLPAHLDGWSTEEFREVARVFADNMQRGNVRGAAFAVYRNHQLVVELSGGYADLEAQRKLTRETNMFGISLSKTIGALLVAKQVEEGKLRFSDRLSALWPKFSANGKESVTIHDVLTHRAGLPTLINSTLHVQDVQEDSLKLQQALESARPLIAVGGVPHYHTVTFGLLVDAVLKRADGRSRRARELLADLDAICGTRLSVGAPLSQFWTLARLYPEQPMDFVNHLDMHFLRVLWSMLWNGGKIVLQDPATGESVPLPVASFFDVLRDFDELVKLNDPQVAATPAVSTNVQGPARDFAKLLHLLVDGRCGGQSDQGIEMRGADLAMNITAVLSPSLVDELHRPVVHAADGVMYYNRTVALGGYLMLSPAGSQWLCTTGFGGLVACADRHFGVSFAYLTNHLQPTFEFDRVGRDLVDATYRVLERSRRAAHV